MTRTVAFPFSFESVSLFYAVSLTRGEIEDRVCTLISNSLLALSAVSGIQGALIIMVVYHFNQHRLWAFGALFISFPRAYLQTS
jgi:hypothetical protein